MVPTVLADSVMVAMALAVSVKVEGVVMFFLMVEAGVLVAAVVMVTVLGLCLWAW